MKDKLKNPNIYYMAVPTLAGIWALLAGFIFYPGSVKAWEDDAKPVYIESQQWMLKLIELQPERLQFQAKQGKDGQFDFGQSIDVLTQLFQIKPSQYTLSVRKAVNKGGKKSRTATMAIKELDIETTGRFLSAMLAISPDLKCEIVSIDKAKTGKDNWNVDITLTYLY